MGWTQKIVAGARTVLGTAGWRRLVVALAVVLMAGGPALAQSTKATPETLPGQARAAQQRSGSPQVATTPGGRVDLNTATEQQLDSLPGIGKKRAAAIIKNRPYKNPDDLVTRKVIPGKVYDGIKDDVTVR